MFKSIGTVIKAIFTVAKNEDLPKAAKPTVKRNKTVDTHIAKLAKEKAAATERNEPWVAIVDMDVDYANLSSGSFNIDWNELFIARLLKAGYQGKTDSDLVDQWFNEVCRHVVLETYEQANADPSVRDGNRKHR